MNTSSNAAVMSNREFYRQREYIALHRIPGVHELIHAHASQRSMLEKRYPDAVFALQIISNPFLKDREAGSIQMDAYVAQHNWD